MNRCDDGWVVRLTEWIDGPYATQEQARQEVFKYIELFYNPIRRHASLDYLSPVEYERRFENHAAVAT